MDRLRAACVQFEAGPDKHENVERMAPLVARAAALGADLVLLPEKWNAHVDGPALRDDAETLPDGGETLAALSAWAAEHRILLVGGSLAVETPAGVGNVSVAFDRDGALRASYTKIHLFDVDVGGFSYR